MTKTDTDYTGDLISLVEYAKMHGRNPVSVRQRAERGAFKTAYKLGRNWVIRSDEPYGDNRRKSDNPD